MLLSKPEVPVIVMAAVICGKASLVDGYAAVKSKPLVASAACSWIVVGPVPLLAATMSPINWLVVVATTGLRSVRSSSASTAGRRRAGALRTVRGLRSNRRRIQERVIMGKLLDLE